MSTTPPQPLDDDPQTFMFDATSRAIIAISQISAMAQSNPSLWPIARPLLQSIANGANTALNWPTMPHEEADAEPAAGEAAPKGGDPAAC